MIIRKATKADSMILAELAIQMWDAHSIGELAASFADIISGSGAACFLAYEEGAAIGFAQCQLRHDYVEGTETSPVGYLEGIFVQERFRHQGCARALLNACEQWAKEKGCTEFASDCELDNEDSLKFHMKMGFEEANRVICFRKDL